MAKTFHLDKK